MPSNTLLLAAICVAIFAVSLSAQTNSFVSVKDGNFYADGKPYYFVGANYWYGGLLGLEKDRKRGVDRLRKELDFLKARGVTNLRLLAGAEGHGLLNGVNRVGPPLQTEPGRFDAKVLDGLDLVLFEMGKRRMRAVVFFSNNWEWSGGFQQYLIWNGLAPTELLTRKPDWNELRDVVAKFYSCKPCKDGYNLQANFILDRRNRYSGFRYVDDPTIMAWELANEPRPMRPTANPDYSRWIRETAAMIKARDKRHLVTIGHEGRIGTEDIGLFETIHADPNIDYLTIHIWPKNWSWFENGKMAEGYAKIAAETNKYITDHDAVARRVNKPLVIEEFGLPRDGQSFDPETKTTLRDKYFTLILGYIGSGNVAGANFWAFGGTARPKTGQIFWREGDEYMGDPPMEEQGLNSVFDRDSSTWDVIKLPRKPAVHK